MKKKKKNVPLGLKLINPQSSLVWTIYLYFCQGTGNENGDEEMRKGIGIGMGMRTNGKWEMGIERYPQ